MTTPEETQDIEYEFSVRIYKDPKISLYLGEISHGNRGKNSTAWESIDDVIQTVTDNLNDFIKEVC